MVIIPSTLDAREEILFDSFYSVIGSELIPRNR